MPTDLSFDALNSRLSQVRDEARKKSMTAFSKSPQMKPDEMLAFLYEQIKNLHIRQSLDETQSKLNTQIATANATQRNANIDASQLKLRNGQWNMLMKNYARLDSRRGIDYDEMKLQYDQEKQKLEKIFKDWGIKPGSQERVERAAIYPVATESIAKEIAELEFLVLPDMSLSTASAPAQKSAGSGGAEAVAPPGGLSIFAAKDPSQKDEKTSSLQKK